MNNTGKKVFLVIVIIAVAVGGFYAGLLIGMKQGRAQAQRELGSIVEIAFPKPPEEMFSLNGTIRDVVGATISLEVSDPNDYLPHADGSSPAKQVRYANLTDRTEILSYDLSRVDANGDPLVAQIGLSDLKAGDSILVKSDANIRDARQFDVTEVNLIRY